MNRQYLGDTIMKHAKQLIIALVLTTAACGGGGGGTPTSPSSSTSTTSTTTTTTSGTMAIQNFAIDLSSSPFLPTSSINVTNWPARIYPLIHIFGKTYEGRPEATLMFDLLKIGTPVYAPFDGTMQEVRDQPETCDTEMYFNDGNNDPLNHMSYDHVRPLDKFRTRGTAFRAGEQVGTIVAWSCTESFGRIEMMVVTQASAGSSSIQARCPMSLVDPSKKAGLTALITSVMDFWNTLRADSAYTASERSNGICATEFAPA